jgi:outer membrane protein
MDPTNRITAAAVPTPQKPAAGLPQPNWSLRGPLWRHATLGACAAVVALAGACASPLTADAERDLRRSVLDSVRRELAQPVQFAEPVVLERERGVERLQLAPELIPELERMAGPGSYDRSTFPMDLDLLGQAQQMVPITLEQAVRSAVQNNLSVQFARLNPAISESQVVAAQAAFDWVFFTNVDAGTTDQPSPGGIARTATRRRLVSTQTGIRRSLPSGGAFTAQQDLNYNDVRTAAPTPNPARDVAWTFRFDQPLLRNFGTDVNLSQVRLARNAERDQIANLKRELLRVVFETERAYWTLVQAQYDILILQRLYERGVVTRDQVIERRILDADPAQIADALARVERRRADVMRSQNALRIASDNLKSLMNHSDLTVGDETMLVPVDMAVDQPITYSVADVLLTAIRNRPEVRQAILSIDNTSIRQLVADNARLPRLDLRLQTRLAGLGDGFGDAYRDIIDRDFVDYIIGFQFEQPIGNRGPEAVFRQRRIERMQATIAYRNTIQQIMLESKRALRLLATNYRLIAQTRVSRYAESENLRSFLVQKQLITGFTIQSLDIEFRRQESLALSEREEIAALTDYNSALAQLYSAMGTSLQHNQIEFDVPEADDPLPEGGLHEPRNRIVPVPNPTPYIAPRTPSRRSAPQE